MAEWLEQVPVNFICVAVLGALGLRRLVLMDAHHEVRVVILTFLLWVSAFYLFSLAFPSSYGDCVPCDEEPCAYTITET